MSRSDWYTRNAHWLILLIYLVGLAPVIWWLGADYSYNRVYSDYATAQAQAQAQAEFDRECVRYIDAQKILTCFREKIKSARETQRSEEDVKAQKQMASWSLGMFIASWVIGLFSLGVAIYVAIFVRKTLITNQKQLVAAQRPWIKVHTKITSGIVVDDEKITISIYFSAKNVGNYPASDVWIEPQIFNLFEDGGVAGYTGTDPRRKMQNLIDAATRRPKRLVFGRLLFQEESDDGIIYNLSLKRPDAQNSPGVDFLDLQLVCCVGYRSDLQEAPHVTAFSRTIRKIDNTDKSAPLYSRLRAIDISEGNIPIEDLHMSHSWMAADYVA